MESCKMLEALREAVELLVINTAAAKNEKK